MNESFVSTNSSNEGRTKNKESEAFDIFSSSSTVQIPLDSNNKVPINGDNLAYVSEIESMLKSLRINFSRQEKSVTCHQPYYRNISQRYKEILIAGGRCALVNHFLAVKFTEDLIFITITSNRMAFSKEFEQDLINFTNFLNLSEVLGQFYVAGGPDYLKENKCLIHSRRIIYNKAKIRLVEEVVKEIMAYERSYVMSIQEHLPQFLSRYQLYNNIFPKIIGGLATSKQAVTKAIKGMGFNQDKQTYITTPLGNVFSLAAAVNTEPWQRSNQPCWKVLQITIEVTDFLITIKIKMNEKQSFRITDDALNLKLSSFINNVNADLKRAQFRINFPKFFVTLESNIITVGLDYTEIQACFQDLFSYMMSVFKKYSETIYNITEVNESSDVSTTNTNNNRELYKDGSTTAPPSSSNDLFLQLKKNRINTDMSDYSLFFIGNASKSTMYLIIPKRFKTISFNDAEYEVEKKIIKKLIPKIDESYHIHLDDINKTIKYPIYNGCTFKDSIKTAKEAAIHTMYTFILRLQQHGFELNKIINNFSIFKEGGGFFVYFSEFPLHSYIKYTDQPISKKIQQDTCLMLTRKIFKAINCHIVQPKKITFLQESSFEKLPNESSEFFIDTYVELVPIQLNEIIELENSPKINHSIIDSYLGFINRDNNYFLVREQMIPVNIAVIDERIIYEYFHEILNAVILAFTLSNKAYMITEEDIFLSQKNKLKLRFKEYNEDHKWKMFKGNNQEEQQVYLLALLLYKMLSQSDPFLKLPNMDLNLLREQINSRIRIPIIPWEFENTRPKIASFLKGCWNEEIRTLADMKNQYPFKI